MKSIITAAILTLGILSAVSAASANPSYDGPKWAQEAFEANG